MRRNRRIFLGVLVVLPTLLLVSPSLAQQPSEPGVNRWLSFAPSGEEFSVALPTSPATYFDYTEQEYKSSTSKYGFHGSLIGGTEIEDVRSYSAYNDGVVYLLHSYKTPDPEKLRSVLQNERIKPGERVREFDLDGCKVLEYRPTAETHFKVVWFIAARAHAYMVAAAARDIHPSITRFFESLRLNNRNSAGIKEYSNLSAVEANARVSPSGAGISEVGEVLTLKEVTRKVVTIWRPEPLYTEAARRDQITGTVRLKMVASSSGQITNIEVIKKLKGGLTDTAVVAARAIKFIPAEKDGRRVSQYITIDYNYNIY